VEVIRGQIERGQLRAGQRLPPERELAVRLGVSRPSVRAGLRTLVTLGIVKTRHGSGTFVSDGPPRLDVRPLRMLGALHGFRADDLDETRRVLEVAVAGLAAERAGREQLVTLAEQVAGMFASVDDPKAFARHDAGFHRAIAAAAGNPILASIVEMVSRLFFEQSRGLTGGSPDDFREAAMRHRNIYHAVHTRDAERARREMGQHLHRRPGSSTNTARRLAGAAS
jgi:GntR family transcriptional repressor for pyruvate dehydrogenase complex